MKKVQRSFAVEYKSGRRKPDAKPNSIWGDMDLKSVARDVEKEAMPFRSPPPQNAQTGETSSTEAKGAEPSLIPQPGQQTTSPSAAEEATANGIDTTTNAEASPVVETPIAPKKQRRPRAKKVASETALAEVAAEVVAVSQRARGKPKPGRKARSVEIAQSAKPAPVKRGPKAVRASVATPSDNIDEMADLLHLEEENQRLRTLLAEKLRAENTDLRKRLKLD